MFKSIKYLTTIDTSISTISYFYSESHNTILPVELKQPDCISHESTLKQILDFFKCELIAVKIYLYQDERFYTYLTIKSQNKTYDINSNPKEAIKLCNKYNVPILVENRILKECGIFVTKAMIEQALEQKE